MKIFRKFILFFAAAVCVASCLDDGPTTSQSYTLISTFEAGKVLGDSLYFDTQVGNGFTWGGYGDIAFLHKLDDAKKEFQGGFIVSWLKPNGEGKERYRVVSKEKNLSSAYVVYYLNPDADKMPENDIVFNLTDYGTCVVSECYVNNTKEVVEAVQNSFEDGDKLVLRMTGYLDGQRTDSKEIVLASYSADKDTIMTTWSRFDLSRLRDVDYVDVEITSSKENVPKAFCLDNLKTDIAISF